MDIRPIEVADDAGLRALYDVSCRAELLGRASAPHWSWQEFAGFLRAHDSGEAKQLVGVWVDDTLVGGARMFLPLLDNTDKGWFNLVVDPPHQRRGFGAALLDDVLAWYRRHGRTRVLTEMTIPFERREDHGYRRFAERHGFEYANVEVVRWQHLPVPDERIRGWIDRAAERHAGYTIETYVDDEVPEELVESLCVLLGQLAVDAPTGAVDFEEESMTPERFREMRKMQHDTGRTVYETVAVTPDRMVVAQTTLNVPAPGRTDAFQWGTFVHREHRGHRLGLAVKAANQRAVQADRPDLRRVVTQNAETNGYMVAINEEMGFEPVEASLEMFIDL